ncbi:hypothetical protein [Romboutsia sp. MSSM.1001216sp_RTP31141st1_G3_RTP31141_220114]|uniref:hypothetical protein n=1 Tax=unclassified Romboutsia TaxID=2626894 RepID=UPI0031B5DB82
MSKFWDKFSFYNRLTFKPIIIWSVLFFIIGLIFEFYEFPNQNFCFLVITIVSITMLFVSVYNKIKHIPYVCKNCSHKFYIKFHQMFAINSGLQSRLKCPFCNRVTWADIYIEEIDEKN